VAERVRGYLAGLACALPASLLFASYRAFNIAISRPKAVMALQLGALALKVPLTALLVFGIAWSTPFGDLHVPALGALGCGIATAIVAVVQMAFAWRVLRRDPFYAQFGLRERIARPTRAGIIPSAIRTPQSRLRRFTKCEITPYTPTAPSTSASDVRSASNDITCRAGPTAISNTRPSVVVC